MIPQLIIFLRSAGNERVFSRLYIFLKSSA